MWNFRKEFNEQEKHKLKQLRNKFQSHLEGEKKAKDLMPSAFSYNQASNVISEH